VAVGVLLGETDGEINLVTIGVLVGVIDGVSVTVGVCDGTGIFTHPTFNVSDCDPLLM
jgi:hypothetical protein